MIAKFKYKLLTSCLCINSNFLPVCSTVKVGSETLSVQVK